MEEARKNMDDILCSERNYKCVDSVLEKIFSICRRRNIKINLEKFTIGRHVEFKGAINEYSSANRQVETSQSKSKVKELLERDPPKNKKDLQSILGSLNQLSQWIPSMKVVIPLMRKMCEVNNHFQTSPELEKEF